MLKLIALLSIAVGTINAEYLVSSQKLPLRKAQAFCEQHGGVLADIPSHAAFQEVQNWSKKANEAGTFWTDMTAKPHAGYGQFPVQSDGTPSTFNEWTGGAKLDLPAGHRRRFLLVNIGVDNEGLFNGMEAFKKKALCKKTEDDDAAHGELEEKIKSLAESLEEYRAATDQQISDLKEQNAALQAQVDKGKQGTSGCLGVVSGNVCIYLPYSVGKAVDYPAAADICDFYGGKLAEIRDTAAFNSVFRYVQRTWSGLDVPLWVGVWTDMKYDYKTGQIVFTNGDTVDGNSIGFWHVATGYPKHLATHDRMRLNVPTRRRDVKAGWAGWTNFPQSAIINVVPLCQYEL